MNETTENFWKAWSEPVAAPAPIFFRLYYNERGEPVSYSMEDLPGNYIEIDAETYHRSSSNVRVVDGKLVPVVYKRPTSKLTPSTAGTPCHPSDVSIVVSTENTHHCWRIKTNES